MNKSVLRLFFRVSFILLIFLTPVIEVIFISEPERYTLGTKFAKNLEYIREKTYADLPPIDILFLGDSRVHVSVNARLIQRILRHGLKKNDLYVENFGHNEKGVDLDYFLFEEVLKERGVKNIFLSLPCVTQNQPNPAIRLLLNPLTDLAGFDFSISSKLLADKLVESPVTIFRKIKGGEKLPEQAAFQFFNGGQLISKAFVRDENLIHEKPPFKEVRAPSLQLTTKDLTARPEEMSFIGSFTPYQEFYIRKIVELAKKKNVHLYYLSMPDYEPGVDVTKVKALSFTDNPDPSIHRLGISTARLFSSSDPEIIEQYFYNLNHTNLNGATHYSFSITPALAEIISKSSKVKQSSL